MADNSFINGTSSSSPEHHDKTSTTINVANDPKKRKRKRLSAVLDKLHNTNNIMMNNSTTNAKNYNTNSISTNNNHLQNNLARSVQENAEILRNLFALSQGLPSHVPTFLNSPFTITVPSPNSTTHCCSSESPECNNNNSKSHNENFAAMKRIKVKEELTIAEDDTKPLHQDFLQHLPKTSTTIYNSNHNVTSLYGQHQMNGGFYYDPPQEFPLDLSMKNFTRNVS